jgi:hypothetical protein
MDKESTDGLQTLRGSALLRERRRERNRKRGVEGQGSITGVTVAEGRGVENIHVERRTEQQKK